MELRSERAKAELVSGEDEYINREMVCVAISSHLELTYFCLPKKTSKFVF